MTRGIEVMTVLARPDAETLSPDGALAQCAAAGAATWVVFASLGGEPPVDVLETARRAGVRSTYELGLGDRRLDDVDPATVVERLVEHIRLLRPEAVVTGPGVGSAWGPDRATLAELVTWAVAAAADPDFHVPSGRPAHRVWIVDVPQLDAEGVGLGEQGMVLVA